MRKHVNRFLRRLHSGRGEPAETKFHDALKLGDSVGPDHRISGYLGAGGFGYTYKAQRTNGATTALKECFPVEFCRRTDGIVGVRALDEAAAFDAIKTRFAEEAGILGALEHPNIVRGGALIEANGTAYIEMEIVDGDLLADFVSPWFRGLSLRDLSEITKQMLAALGHIHDCGYLHKDISPDNIILTSDGAAKLIDFGSATAIEAENTDDPMLVVKAGYSPHEFYRADAKVGKASDLYQLGATLRHCITGKRPVESITRLMAKAKGQEDPLPPMPRLPTSGQRRVLEPIDQAMAVLLGDRMPTAADWHHGPIASTG